MYHYALSTYFFKRKTNPWLYQIYFCIWANWCVVSTYQYENRVDCEFSEKRLTIDSDCEFSEKRMNIDSDWELRDIIL